MKRLVVGVDGSTPAGQALQWAGDLAVRVGAEIVAAHAFDSGLAKVSPERGVQILAERHALLEDDWVRPVVELGVSIRPEMKTGDARTALLAIADEEDADLVVLGRTGHGGGPGFVHLGSVVEHLAHHTRRPLAVIPANVWGAVRRVILGVDGSEGSRAAVNWCAEIAAEAGATVVAVAIDEPFLEWTPASSPDNWRCAAEREVDERTAPLCAAGIAVEAVALRDLHPADGLLGAASARRGDLLVIGTRGTGGFTGLRAGGVAMKVLHRASLPVVLVPPTT